MPKNLITPMNKKLAPLRAKNDVTHAIQLKFHGRMNKSRFEEILTSYGCNKNLDDEVKKHKRKRPDVQFKECSLTKQKTRPSRDYERTGKTIFKKK